LKGSIEPKGLDESQVFAVVKYRIASARTVIAKAAGFVLVQVIMTMMMMMMMMMMTMIIIIIITL
jgi:hypothetical protein